MSAESKQRNIESLTTKLSELKAVYDKRVGDLDEKIAEAQELLRHLEGIEQAALKGEVYQFPEDSKYKGKTTRSLKMKYEKLTQKIEEQKKKVQDWLDEKTKKIREGIQKADDKINEIQEKASKEEAEAQKEQLKQKLEDKMKAKANAMSA